MKTSRVIIFLFTVCLSSTSSAAQYVRPTTGGTMREFNFNNPMSALAATMVMNRAREDALAKRLGARPNSNQSSAHPTTTGTQPPPAQKLDESVLRFRSTGSYVKSKELADQIGRDPAERETILKIMNAVLDGFGRKTRAAGLQNDLAIALSYFFGENIRVYRGLPELSDQQFINMRNMMANTLVSGGFGNGTDRQKQEMYEVLVAATGFTQFAYEQAIQANKPDLAKTYQQVAGLNLQALTKVSADSFNITGDGLTVATEGDSNAGSPPVSNGKGASENGGAIEIRQLAYEFKENDSAGISSLGTNCRQRNSFCGKSLVRVLISPVPEFCCSMSPCEWS